MLLKLGTISFACLLLFFSGCRDDNKSESKSATGDAMMSDNCTSAKTSSQAVHMSTDGSIRPSVFDHDKNEDTPKQSPTNTSVFHDQTR